MIFGSCHFLFHQSIQRDKIRVIILDMDFLMSLAAALVRRSNADRLDQAAAVFGAFHSPFGSLGDNLLLQ